MNKGIKIIILVLFVFECEVFDYFMSRKRASPTHSPSLLSVEHESNSATESSNIPPPIASVHMPSLLVRAAYLY